MTDSRISAIQDAFSNYADANLQAVVCAVINEQGEVESLFYGNAGQQTLLTSFITANVHNALISMYREQNVGEANL